jgi:hypothetical protein
MCSRMTGNTFKEGEIKILGREEWGGGGGVGGSCWLNSGELAALRSRNYFLRLQLRPFRKLQLLSGTGSGDKCYKIFYESKSSYSYLLMC